jgi:hypothetical protein
MVASLPSSLAPLSINEIYLRDSIFQPLENTDGITSVLDNYPDSS